VISSFTTAGTYTILSHSYRQQLAPPSLGLKGMFTRFPHAFTATITGSILMVMGLLALCLGFFLVLPIFTLGLPLAVDQRMLGISAMQQSWQLVKPQFWRSLGYVLATGLLVVIPAWFLGVLTVLIPQLKPWYIQGGLGSLVGLTSLFMNCFLFVYYKALQAHAKMRL
jgi:uncharacterized membrane protein